MRGLWIAGALLVACSSLAEPPKSSNASSKSPTVEIKPAEGEQNSHYPTQDAPLPVQIFQSKEDAKSGSDRETKTDKYNADYLNTQVALVETSKKQLIVSVATAVIALVGSVTAAIALIFLIGTFRANKRSADEATAQTEIARKGLISTNRPRLEIRNLRISIDHKVKSVCVQYRIVNVGYSKTRIIRWNETWIMPEKLIFPADPFRSPNKNLTGVLPLESGMSWPSEPKIFFPDPTLSAYRRMTQQKATSFLYF
jgi:hypothetical protein